MGRGREGSGQLSQGPACLASLPPPVLWTLLSVPTMSSNLYTLPHLASDFPSRSPDGAA